MWGGWARCSSNTKGCPLKKTKARVFTDFQLLPLFTSHVLALTEKLGGKKVGVKREQHVQRCTGGELSVYLTSQRGFGWPMGFENHCATKIL